MTNSEESENNIHIHEFITIWKKKSPSQLNLEDKWRDRYHTSADVKTLQKSPRIREIIIEDQQKEVDLRYVPKRSGSARKKRINFKTMFVRKRTRSKSCTNNT